MTAAVLLKAFGRPHIASHYQRIMPPLPTEINGIIIPGRCSQASLAGISFDRYRN
jgi:hypothetical protein